MAKTFSIICTRCNTAVEFKPGAVKGLEDYIEDRITDDDFLGGPDFDDDAVCPSEFTGGDRPLWQLAAAIRRGDQTEAEIYLDRVADIIGNRAVEEVQQGRFSRAAQG